MQSPQKDCEQDTLATLRHEAGYSGCGFVSGLLTHCDILWEKFTKTIVTGSQIICAKVCYIVPHTYVFMIMVFKVYTHLPRVQQNKNIIYEDLMMNYS